MIAIKPKCFSNGIKCYRPENSYDFNIESMSERENFINLCKLIFTNN